MGYGSGDSSGPLDSMKILKAGRLDWMLTVRLTAAFRGPDHVPYSSKHAGVRPGLPAAAQASVLTFIST